VLELYEIADGKAKPKKGDPSVVICMDEFGRSNLLPRPASSGPRIVKDDGPAGNPGADGAGHLHRTKACGHLMAAYDLGTDKMYAT